MRDGIPPRDSLLPLRRAVLRDPLCDIAFAPDTAGSKLAYWLRKARRSRQLVSALFAYIESHSDLGYAHQFHRKAAYPLTASSVKCYRPLDNIKRPRVALTTGAAT